MNTPFAVPQRRSLEKPVGRLRKGRARCARTFGCACKSHNFSRVFAACKPRGGEFSYGTILAHPRWRRKCLPTPAFPEVLKGLHGRYTEETGKGDKKLRKPALILSAFHEVSISKAQWEPRFNGIKKHPSAIFSHPLRILPWNIVHLPRRYGASREGTQAGLREEPLRRGPLRCSLSHDTLHRGETREKHL